MQLEKLKTNKETYYVKASSRHLQLECKQYR